MRSISSKLGRAFTIVELIVVITVIGILAGLTILGFGAWQKSIHISAVKSDLNGAASAMASARTFSSGYPTSTSGTNITSVVSTFTPSAGVVLTYGGGDATNYCLDGNYSGDASTTYYIDSLPGDTAPISGTCATRTNVPVPSAPTGLVASGITDTQVTLNWGATTYASSYSVQCSPDSGFTTGLVTSTPTANTSTLTGLTQLTDYHCRVNAVDNAGMGPWSTVILFTTSYTPLTAPTGLSATSSAMTTASFTWGAVAGAVSYNVQQATNSSFTSPAVYSKTTTSLAATGLSPSTQYYFRVQAVDSNSNLGTWSTSASAATYTDWSVYSKFAVVGDWNRDGYNDVVGYKPDGTVDLHLGHGNNTLGPAITLTNIGTSVRDIIGPGTLPSGTAPIIWWDNSDGTGHALPSNGATGISGSPLASGTGWNTCTTVFAAPKFLASTTTIICESSSLIEYSLSSSAVTTLGTSFGSGWNSSFGANVFGAGDFSVNGYGDIIGITSAGALDLYSGNGDGTTAGGIQEGSSWVTNFTTGGWDLSGDAYTDILRYYSPTNTMYIYLGVGSGAIGSSVIVN